MTEIEPLTYGSDRLIRQWRERYMVPSCGDRQEPRPWMLGEIEDVAYRLRLGGADDSTELRFKRDAIEACVPFAEFALAPVQRPAPVAAEVDRPSARWHTPARVVALAFLFAVIMVAVALGVVA